MSSASYSRDVALLLSIMKNKKKIKDVVETVKAVRDRAEYCKEHKKST